MLGQHYTKAISADLSTKEAGKPRAGCSFNIALQLDQHSVKSHVLCDLVLLETPNVCIPILYAPRNPSYRNAIRVSVPRNNK